MSSTEIGVRSGGGQSLGSSDDSRPLTDQEVQLVHRLLSDPFSFPLEFKAWLISYLETSDLSLPMASVIGLRSTLGISGAGEGTLGIFPAGIVLPYAGNTAPTGSLMCDGASYTTAGQSRLFAAIGYSYGGAGGNFNVPDIRGRFPVGKGAHATVDTVGKNEGAALANRSPKHRHAIGANLAGNISGGSAVSFNATDYPVDGTGYTSGPGDTQQDGGAFEVVNFIIVS